MKKTFKRPDNFPENPSDEQQAVRDAQQRENTFKNEEKENRTNTVWLYLAMTLDSTTLVTVRPIHQDSRILQSTSASRETPESRYFQRAECNLIA